MSPVPNVDKVLATPSEFLDYLDDIRFGAWRPRFVTVHHTGAPTLANWYAWQKRKVPVTDEQWLRNLAAYYGNELGWSSAPHFFFTPEHYCVLSPPWKRGVHAASFNGLSWGVEMVGNFDVEAFPAELQQRYIDGIACLHLATGLKVLPFQQGVQGMHFHRNDPRTTKTCPGLKINQPWLAGQVIAAIERITNQEAPAEQVSVSPQGDRRTGIVIGVAPDDTLNVRADPSGKSVVVGRLRNENGVIITGNAMNGATKWYSIDIPGDADGWVAARYIRIVPS